MALTKRSTKGAPITAAEHDATLDHVLARSNHTGTQAASTVTGLSTVATSGVYGDLAGLPTIATTIAGLSDVPDVDPAEGDVLVWRADTYVYEPKPEVGSNPALNDVADVTITTPGDNALLAYDITAAAWINQTAAEAGLALTLHTHALADISDAGTAAGAATTDFATAAQGAAADTALQPGDAIISDPDPDPVKGESALINMVEVTREAHDTRVANGDLMDDKTYWIIEGTV